MAKWVFTVAIITLGLFAIFMPRGGAAEESKGPRACADISVPLDPGYGVSDVRILQVCS